MNYQKIYNNLITKRQNEILSKEIYGEKHHIIPKCLGGTDDKSNLVRLTAREHYIAHLLLAKIHNTFGLYSAVIYMQTSRIENRKFKFNSRLYQKIREEFARKISANNKGKKRKPFSDEHKRKLSESHKGERNIMFGKTHSEEARQKIAEARKGKNNHPNWKPNKEQCKKISEEAKNRLSDKTNHPMYGKQQSEETKRKISEAKKKGKIPWNKGKKKNQGN